MPQTKRAGFRRLRCGFEVPWWWIRTICCHITDVLGAGAPGFLSLVTSSSSTCSGTLQGRDVGLVVFCSVTQEARCCWCWDADLINIISASVGPDGGAAVQITVMFPSGAVSESPAAGRGGGERGEEGGGKERVEMERKSDQPPSLSHHSTSPLQLYERKQTTAGETDDAKVPDHISPTMGWPVRREAFRD